MDMPAFEQLFKLSTFHLWTLGIRGTNVHFRFYVIFFIYAPIIVEEVGCFITKASSDHLVELAGLAPCISYCTISVVKVCTVLSKRSKIVKLTKNVKELYHEILESPKKAEAIRSEIVFVQKLTKYLFTLNFMLVTVYNISSLLIMLYCYVVEKRVVFELPYPIVVPFETEAWIPWFFLYVHSITCSYICITYTITLDCLYFLLVTLVCVNYTTLSEEFENLQRNKFKDMYECIRKHQYLIQLSEDLDDIFQLPNFFNVLFGAIQICALGFCITAGEWSNQPGYFLFLATVVAQIWAISVFGQTIISRSSKINEALWKSIWYDMDVKTMKTVMFVIVRSQKPQRLTAYLFSTVCMSSFRKIMSNSWSYFSILRSAYKSPGSK